MRPYEDRCGYTQFLWTCMGHMMMAEAAGNSELSLVPPLDDRIASASRSSNR